MTSIYTVNLTEKAEEDYNEIIMGILEISLWRRSVEKWGNKIMARIESLRLFPEFGRKTKAGYYMVRIGKYRIIYDVLKEEKIVLILRIVYSRKNLDKIGLK